MHEILYKNEKATMIGELPRLGKIDFPTVKIFPADQRKPHSVQSIPSINWSP